MQQDAPLPRWVDCMQKRGREQRLVAKEQASSIKCLTNAGSRWLIIPFTPSHFAPYPLFCLCCLASSLVSRLCPCLVAYPRRGRMDRWIPGVLGCIESQWGWPFYAVFPSIFSFASEARRSGPSSVLLAFCLMKKRGQNFLLVQAKWLDCNGRRCWWLTFAIGRCIYKSWL